MIKNYKFMCGSFGAVELCHLYSFIAISPENYVSKTHGMSNMATTHTLKLIKKIGLIENHITENMCRMKTKHYTEKTHQNARTSQNLVIILIQIWGNLWIRTNVSSATMPKHLQKDTKKTWGFTLMKNVIIQDRKGTTPTDKEISEVFIIFNTCC